MSTPPIVIIAEPDPMIASVLRVEFTHMDFIVLLAASGQEVEDYASHVIAHLIVVDAKLRLGAYDACARIRRRPGYANRPIVLTTNKMSPAVQAAADAAGATCVLPKPYSVADMFAALQPSLPPDDLLLTQRARVRHERAEGMDAGRAAHLENQRRFRLGPQRTSTANRPRQKRQDPGLPDDGCLNDWSLHDGTLNDRA